MYRKILFISINFLKGMHIFTKAALLLFFSSISVLLTMFYKPFIMKKLNYLEFFSNLAVCITMYCGALYVQEQIHEALKSFLFFMILFVNIMFGFFWIWSVFELTFHSHYTFFYKHFPRFTKYMVAFEMSLIKIGFEWNVIRYSIKLMNSTSVCAKEYNLNVPQTPTKTHKQNRDSIKITQLKTFTIDIKAKEIF